MRVNDFLHGYSLLTTVQPAGILCIPYVSASANGFVNVPEDATLVTQLPVGFVA